MGKSEKSKAHGSATSCRMTGKETFHDNGKSIGFNLISFWQWFGSHLNSSAFRGNLAEYLIKQATGAQGNPNVHKNKDVRATWDDCDLVFPKTKNGIEVKSSAYIQEWGWERTKHSTPIFGIAPSASWNKAKGTRSKEVKRHSKVYVFCLLKEKNPKILDPMNVSQWTFWVLSTRILDKYLPDQKTIRIPLLEKLGAENVNYFGLKDAVKRAMGKA